MGRLQNKLKQNPKLIQHEMSDGRASLWLEYYLGRSETPLYDDDGNPLLYESGAMKGTPKYKVRHNRKKEALNLYVWIHPRTAEERNKTRTRSNSPRAYASSVSNSCWRTATATV